jgi:hypothetical protein
VTTTRVHHNPGLDPNNPATWPPWLRSRDICKRPGYPGILPVTESAFRDAVGRGAVAPPTPFGRAKAWAREYIRGLQQRGIPGRTRTATED